jgi:hypothetical protein
MNPNASTPIAILPSAKSPMAWSPAAITPRAHFARPVTGSRTPTATWIQGHPRMERMERYSKGAPRVCASKKPPKSAASPVEDCARTCTPLSERSRSSASSATLA